VKDGDLLRNMTLAEYLPGVLSAEMPESFPDEALRAQAVAARSFTLYKMAHPDGNKHPDAAVCTDPNCCKAYLPPPYTERMTGAVRDTDGVAALYGGEPVLAVFHAASGGRTEACADVWGKDVPYLQSVESPGEENSPRYYGRVEMTLDEFTGTFLKYYPDAQFGKSPQGWFTNIRRSEAGGVRELTVGGVTVPGTALRGMFGLQSTNMVITAGAESVVIDTLGHGHGVGLSQYGAAALAEQGKPYDEILKWYYTGVTVAPYAP
jgi:stage II sporulation protein D